ncbi:MAG TPA: PEP/pyruvate-binding domain-containing protein, partial [Candidatus Thermoplasmatota archaeon]|nr:PEP/pyruvate-binding domain-containing protein [Candidatus Thermoplasmatota archaeon]
MLWFVEIRKEHLPTVGGKAANLGEMLSFSIPVPPGFCVTTLAFQRFLDEAGLAKEIFGTLAQLNVDDNKALHEASDRIRKSIVATKVPKSLRDDVTKSYKDLVKGERDGLVAVRSSATAEDLPEASFAGQQDTYLNVDGEEDVLQHVVRCFASLYTPRAIFYRSKHDFSHEKVAIAVVVQKMVDADKAGVMFTKHPTRGDETVIVEAAWGLGEGVVSGNVSPDTYELTGDGKPTRIRVARKETRYVRLPHGGTGAEPVPRELLEKRVLSDAELKQLAGLGRTIESHYGTPQDVEWAFGKDLNLYVLQTRPITTIKKSGPATSAAGPQGTVLVTGLGASPGIASGKVAVLAGAEELDKCKQGDVLVTQMTTPDMVPAMRRAVAIVTDEGGMTCHAAIVARELGVPCVVGTKQATRTLRDGLVVTIDGDKGSVTEG